MIGAVQVKLLSMELASARNVLTDSQSMAPASAEVQAEVVLELSAEAQQLMQVPLDDAA